MIVLVVIYIKKELKTIEKNSTYPVSLEPNSESRRKNLIIGLGNTILSDDGVGIYVARELAKRIPSDAVTVKEASVGGLELLDLIKGYERILLIDAVMTGQADVGSLIHLKLEDLAGGSAMTRHQVSFSEALELGKRLNMNLPEEIVIFGIEVEDIFTFGESCTPKVQSKIEDIVEEIVQLEFS
jgi:hydrogenase maturation protease